MLCKILYIIYLPIVWKVLTLIGTLLCCIYYPRVHKKLKHFIIYFPKVNSPIGKILMPGVVMKFRKNNTKYRHNIERHNKQFKHLKVKFNKTRHILKYLNPSSILFTLIGIITPVPIIISFLVMMISSILTLHLLIIEEKIDNMLTNFK